MHITNRNPEPQSSLAAISMKSRTDPGNEGGGSPAMALGNRVYELGVRTEREHGTGSQSPLSRMEDPLARFFARKPGKDGEYLETPDVRDWISDRRQRSAAR